VVTTIAIIALAQAHGRCFPSSVLPAAKMPRYLFNPAATDQYTVQIVTARQTR